MNSDTNDPSFNRARNTWPWVWLVLAVVLWLGTCLWALNYAGFVVNPLRSVASEPVEDNLSQRAGVVDPAQESNGAIETVNGQTADVSDTEATRLEAERKAAEEAARIEAAEEAARIKAEREAAEEAARVQAEREAAEEAARVEAEREAAEEAARVEAEREAAEEAARVEAEREAAEEAARVEAEREAAVEAARVEAEREAAEEAARVEAEREAAEEAARVEAEREAEEEARTKAAEEAAKALEEVQTQAETEAREALEAERLDAFREQQEIDAQARRTAAEEATRVAAVAERRRNYDLLRAQELRTLSSLSTQVQFLSQSSTVSRELERPLDRMFEPLYLYSDVAVVISVATNERGPAASDDALSEERAQSIVGYLVSRGLEEQRFRIQVDPGSELPPGTHRVRVFVQEEDQ